MYVLMLMNDIEIIKSRVQTTLKRTTRFVCTFKIMANGILTRAIWPLVREVPIGDVKYKLC